MNAADAEAGERGRDAWWDVAHAVSAPQIATFSLMCLGSAAFVLYHAFAFDALLSREHT